MNYLELIDLLEEKVRKREHPDKASLFYLHELLEHPELRLNTQVIQAPWLEMAVNQRLFKRTEGGSRIVYYDTGCVAGREFYRGQGHAGPHMFYFFYYKSRNMGLVTLIEEPDGDWLTAAITVDNESVPVLSFN